MVFVNDKKYACETCIKGHRSSTCNHSDRPLFEIKKKGRPVTQCEHCRELRKAKQVHVKCLCEGKVDPETAVSHSIPAKKANRNKGAIPSAAFPHGLQPDMAGASMPPEFQTTEQRTEVPCTCPAGGPCKCYTNRQTSKAAKNASSSAKQGGHAVSSRDATPPNSNPGNVGGQFRPIASRPSPMPIQSNLHGIGSHFTASDSLYGGTQEQPHPLAHGHAMRSTHGSALYNPYGTVAGQQYRTPPNSFSPENRAGLVAPMMLTGQQWPSSMAPYSSHSSSNTGDPGLQWPSSNGDQLLPNLFESLCQCGDTCACPGCVTHQGSSAMSLGAAPATTCSNPGRCVACQNCVDNFAYSQTGLSFDPAQFTSTDDWLSQLTTTSPAISTLAPMLPSGGRGNSSSMPILPQFTNLGLGATEGAALYPGYGMQLSSGSGHVGVASSRVPGVRAPHGYLPFQSNSSVAPASSSQSLPDHQGFSRGTTAPGARFGVGDHPTSVTQNPNFLSVANPFSDLSRSPSSGSVSSRSSSSSASESRNIPRDGASFSSRNTGFSSTNSPRDPFSMP